MSRVEQTEKERPEDEPGEVADPREQKRGSAAAGDGGSDSDSDADAARKLDVADLKLVLVGGGIAAAVLFTVVWSVGAAGDAEARILLEAAAPALRFLSSASITAGSTILALMLTVLGLSDRTSRSFKDLHYRRIQRISVMAVCTILLAVILLMFIGVPLEESDALRRFYAYLYYGFLSSGAILGGVFVAMVLMLGRTILGLAEAFSPHLESGFTEE